MAKEIVMPPTEKLELEDIQGLLIRGHSTHRHAAYLMLNVSTAQGARNWLAEILPLVAHGGHKSNEIRVQVAFTWEGMAMLGVSETEFPGFRSEFIQGITAEHRSRFLGDREDSDPEHWHWGGPNNPTVHIVLMLFASSTGQMEEALAQFRTQFEGFGLTENIALTGGLNPKSKEHFGFRDGISQPTIPGLSRRNDPTNSVAAGEFILGYLNAYGQAPDTPEAKPQSDPQNHLPILGNGMKDLGRNGSYMIFRQLRQDVSAFWQFILQAVKRENPDAGPEEAIMLATKMVGRWPGGAPLAVSPDEDHPDMAIHNAFGYHENDIDGFRCPIGSHVRRSNPRDTLQGGKPLSALKISNRHRILRRGRSYGPPLSPDCEPHSLMTSPDDGMDRGLQFICFNTNISRQFEFVQHQWNDNTKFEGLYNDPDPILGIKDSRNKSETHDFTIQACPVRKKVTGLRRFVHVQGGAYFFMPGIKALRYLSQLN